MNKEMSMDRNDITEWFTEWRNPIRSWLRNRRSVPPGDIDDLAQEVFMRLLRYDDGRVIENPQGYLFSIAANVASEWRSRCSVRKPHDDSWLDELPIESADEPENALEREQRDARVQSAINRLPRRQRETLLLHRDGLTYNQIAERNGVTYRLVLRDLTRAYASLRRELFDA